MVDGVGASELRSLLDQGLLIPSKALGQNFLVDPNIAQKIARIASSSGHDRVLEIGPGVGSLTVFLSKYFDSVVAIDLDRYIFEPLGRTLSSRGIENVSLVHANALKDDLSPYLQTDKEYVLAANLPYNIASHVIVKVLETVKTIQRLVVMVQFEVAQRLCASISSKDYSSLSVKVGYYAKSKIVMKVPPTVFIPKPSVNSAVVELVRLPDRDITANEYEWTFALVKEAFSHRRQMLRRSLHRYGGEELLEAASIDPTLRAENIDVEVWIRLGRLAALMKSG